MGGIFHWAYFIFFARVNFEFRDLLGENVEEQGIDPCASCMLSMRSCNRVLACQGPGIEPDNEIIFSILTKEIPKLKKLANPSFDLGL